MKQLLSMVVIAGTLTIIRSVPAQRKNPWQPPPIFHLRVIHPPTIATSVNLNWLPIIGLITDLRSTLTLLKVLLLQLMQVVTAL